MMGKYLLVIICLAFSFSVNGQHRKSQRQAEDSVGTPAVNTDNGQVEGSSGGTIGDIIPNNVDNFCPVITQLMIDAAANFDRIRGKEIETIANTTTFTSMGGVPGAITSWLERTPTKWRYQGIVFQGNSKEDMQVAFDKFKNSLENCLPAKGYLMTTAKNASPKLESYPEYKYAMGNDEGKSSGSSKDGKHGNQPKATLDVDYTAGTDIYVITVNLWSN